MTVGCLADAFSAFRIFRELFWDSLRTRASAPPVAKQADARPAESTSNNAPVERQDSLANRDGAASSRPGSANKASSSTSATTPASSAETQQLVASLKQELKDRESELKMLRAALAAQPA